MTRILFVANVVKTHIQVFHLPYIAWCKAQDWEVHVAARNDYGNAQCAISGCDAYFDIPFPRTPVSLDIVKAYRALKNVINKNDYDIIHCHTPIAGVLARLAARGARKQGAKLIYTAHGFHFFQGAPWKNWLYYPIEKHFARDTDVLITINTEDYARAVSHRFRAKEIAYVPGVGIDLDRFRSSRDRTAKRAELGVASNAVLLLSVGELLPNKNQITILKAMAKASDDALRYALCGVGPEEPVLRQTACKLAIEDRVMLLGFRKDIAEICAAADIFVFPSHREGLSLALMEAMAAGLPCVASDIRGNRELIEPELGGYLCAPDDEDAFTEALLRLAGDTTLRKRMGDYNQEKVQEYSLARVLPQVTAIYQRCASKEGESR